MQMRSHRRFLLPLERISIGDTLSLTLWADAAQLSTCNAVDLRVLGCGNGQTGGAGRPMRKETFP